MGYTNINITYNEGSLCEEISFSEPGEVKYTLGSTITFKCPTFHRGQSLRDRKMIIFSVGYTESAEGGITTTVSGFSDEYKYTRKSPSSDLSFITMTQDDHEKYQEANPKSDSVMFITYGDDYGSDGWTMRRIVNYLSQSMGLAVANTLPNYYVSDFTVSVGSTYFEAIANLVSVFNPLILISGETLYIIERSGAGNMSAGSVSLNNITFVDGIERTPGGEQGIALSESGIISNTVDSEYTPIPGCIKVEGQEGEYIASKDVSNVNTNPTKDDVTTRETITNKDGTTANYVDTFKFYTDPYGNLWAAIERIEECTIRDGYWFSTQTKNTITTEYDPDTLNFKYANPVLITETEKHEAWVGSSYSGGLKAYNQVETSYIYDEWDEALKKQVATKQELFVYNDDEGTYEKYDPRDYDPDEDGTELLLVQTEQRSTVYNYLSEEAYSIDNQITSQVYNDEEEEWQTIYTFDHDVVLAGGQQHTGSGVSSLRTLQVFEQDCLFTPTTISFDEPPLVFSIPTPSWDSIYGCYIAIKAMLDFEVQKGTIETLATNWDFHESSGEWNRTVFDPIPFMGITGLSDLMTSNTDGGYYIRGYNINLSHSGGYTVNLNVEAKRD